MFKVKKNNILLLCYALAVGSYALKQTNITHMGSWVNIILIITKIFAFYVPLILEFIVSFSSRFNKKVFFLITIIGILILGNIMFNEGSIDLLYILYFMYICRLLNPQEILITYAKTIFYVILIVLVSWRLGLIESTFIRGNDSLGFVYSTFGPNMFLSACIAYVSGKKRNISFIKWLIILIINYWFYNKTTTLSPFVFILILFILYYLFKIQRISNILLNKNIISYILSRASYWIASATIIFQVLYNKFHNESIWIQFNSFFSNRLIMGYQAFEKYSVKLFGQPILWNTGLTSSGNYEYFYIDSSYIQILFRYGIIMLILICFLMTMIEKYCIYNKNKYMLLGILIFLLHCIADPQLLSFRYNPFLICIAAIFMNKNKNSDNVLLKGEINE